MALQTIDKLAGLGSPGFFEWEYEDTNNNVQRLRWGNTSSDQVLRIILKNPAGKVLVDTQNMQPGASGSLNIAPPDRFDMFDERLSVNIAYGPIGG